MAPDSDIPKIQTKIDDLKSKYGEALPDENHSLQEGVGPDGTVTFYESVFRVELGKDSDKLTEKQDLLDQIQNEADKSASWWQTRWHECTNDNDTRTGMGEHEFQDGTTVTFEKELEGCEWQEKTYSNESAIPSEVRY